MLIIVYCSEARTFDTTSRPYRTDSRYARIDKQQRKPNHKPIQLTRARLLGFEVVSIHDKSFVFVNFVVLPQHCRSTLVMPRESY
jgi:hypothetical protein